MSASVELIEVSKLFGSQTVAVDRVSLRVEPGEIFVLVGPSGSGKSSILRLIAGFERPDAGRIEIDGQVVENRRNRTFVPPERRGVGMVFQEYALFPHLRVGENLRFGLGGLSRAQQDTRVNELLRLVDLQGLEQRYPHQLSGGQQQRVAVARALAPGPRVLLLDEPLSNLDSGLRARTRGELARVLRAAGTTAILVTHDQEEAFELADRVGVLMGGRVVQVGQPAEIYDRPVTRQVAEFAGEADFLPGTIEPGGTLRTELGTVPGTTPMFPTGTPVDVLLRPDDVDLVGDRQGIGLIVERRYRGDTMSYRVRMPSGRELRSRMLDQSLSEGDRVRVTLRQHHPLAVFLRDSDLHVEPPPTGPAAASGHQGAA